MILIADNKKPDWNKIRGEYIAGGISQRQLAKKYNIAEGTLLQRANIEGWKALRERATIKAITETEQKTATAVADNAVKLEQARQAAIEAVRAGIEKLSTMQGSKISTRQKDSKGNPVTVDFNLLDMVTALEKLQKMGGSNDNTTPVQVIIDV